MLAGEMGCLRCRPVSVGFELILLGLGWLVWLLRLTLLVEVCG